MNRVDALFAQSKKEGKTAFVPFLLAGYPSLEATLDHLKVLARSGADAIELGVPCSDPIADGPLIQAAHHAAIATTLEDTLLMLQDFRASYPDFPVSLMVYSNTVFHLGPEEFCHKAEASGVDALLSVDGISYVLPNWQHALQEAGFCLPRLIAPTTSKERFVSIQEEASGYLYYVTMKGVTGSASKLDLGDVRGKLSVFKEVQRLPIMLGFGLQSPEHMQKARTLGDALVVGSAMVQKSAEGSEALARFCTVMADACHGIDARY